MMQSYVWFIRCVAACNAALFEEAYMLDWMRKYKPTSAIPVSGAAASRPGADPVKIKREKIIAAMQRQISAVQKEIEGKPHGFTVRKKDESGEIVERPARFIPMWFKDNEGGISSFIKYGTVALEIEGHTKFKCGNEISDAIPFYEALIKSAEKGDIDEPLSKAAERKRDVGTPLETGETEEPVKLVSTNFKRSARK